MDEAMEIFRKEQSTIENKGRESRIPWSRSESAVDDPRLSRRGITHTYENQNAAKDTARIALQTFPGIKRLENCLSGS
jgi:hypothetical protein